MQKDFFLSQPEQNFSGGDVTACYISNFKKNYK